MDTKPLESFAKVARRELIAAVEARLSAVLSAGSVARSERAETVRLLESQIADHGREHVIDKVAYTWFNRLIALRFMDARGYTNAGVVSPASGHAHGQPEILADAKRGVLDSQVVIDAGAQEAIIGLLDGTRRSTDAEGEAYALLLTEYCRHWHKTMPFMFEAGGAYTELLVPAGLLAGGAFLSRAREVLTEDVCDDVEVIGWLYQFYISERKEEVFAGFKKNKKAGADEIPAATQLFTPHWIVRYLLENSLGRLWMLNRPASRLVDQMDYYIAPIDKETDFVKVLGPEELTVIDPACGSGHMLTYAFDLLYAIYEEEGYAPSEIPSLILTHNLNGAEIDPRAGALASFALTMKARAKDRRFFTRLANDPCLDPRICVIESISFTPDELNLLITKSGDRIAEEEFWNQFRDADTLGSLVRPNAAATQRAVAVLDGLKDLEETLYYDTLNRARQVVAQADVLSQPYAVVTANPPYMGGKNMDARLAAFAKEYFPNSKSDLFAMFIERCLDFLPVGGHLGLMTPFVWMFIASYEALRNRIIHEETISTLVQLEYSGFDGATVPICAYVLRRGRSDQIGAFVRLADFVGPIVQGPKTLEIIKADRLYRVGEASGDMKRYLYRIATSEFAKVPGTPIAYWLSDAMRAAFTKGRPLKEVADVKAGVGTRDDGRFMRSHWEVSFLRIGRSKKWLLTDKAGEFRKWYAGMQYVMNWENEGYEIRNFKNADGSLKSRPQNLQFMYREGVTWGKIGSGESSFRLRPEGFGFNDAAPTIFGGDPAEILMQMNSTACRALLEATGSTLNVQTGMIENLPILDEGVIPAGQARSISSELVETSRADWDDFETSWDFKRPSWLRDFAGHGSLRQYYSVWSRNQLRAAREQQARETYWRVPCE
ncbi:BREX-1 system adenine-specific DNA-methyltransferase PglX [Rhodococcus pyridinivorans]|uniref:BREX-1 system adenine-specific DNA-methyltransferase PglX n=1 Tax=Rhodococcus pyridinivorans TaxID=103816 RepID=UPI0009BEDDC5|nr:BREX-1 system adenine-specific DNA-methyltransferase PglX [Rhodococcus pyridinivorans]